MCKKALLLICAMTIACLAIILMFIPIATESRYFCLTTSSLQSETRYFWGLFKSTTYEQSSFENWLSSQSLDVSHEWVLIGVNRVYIFSTMIDPSVEAEPTKIKHIPNAKFDDFTKKASKEALMEFYRLYTSEDGDKVKAIQMLESN